MCEKIFIFEVEVGAGMRAFFLALPTFLSVKFSFDYCGRDATLEKRKMTYA